MLFRSENIFVERLPQRKGFVHKEELNRQASEVLEQFHTGIKPTQLVEELSVSEQQIVEIAKVVSEECRIIIFDEPTSSLNEEEACQLFKIIEELKEKGVGIYYISHKLSEIFEICDRITILRDGEYIATHRIEETTQEIVVQEMVGRELSSFYPEKNSKTEKTE